jgi:hypothetical protein
VIYEQVRAEALQQTGAPPSWALERVRRYGVVGLFPNAKHDLSFILYAQSVPRPAWSGKRDVERETLHRVYACLITAGLARPDSETIEPIIDTVDASGVIDATVEDVHALDTGHGVSHASSVVCSGFQ